jgi:hypothetical protein
MKTNSNLNSGSGAQSRTAKLNEANPQIDLQKRQFNRALPLPRVLHLLQTQAPDFWAIAEVVGKWVWIQFEDKQPREITAVLAELGFHWNNRRQVWQHPCGQIMTRSLYDPRRRYGSYFPADQQAA